MDVHSAFKWGSGAYFVSGDAALAVTHLVVVVVVVVVVLLLLLLVTLK